MCGGRGTRLDRGEKPLFEVAGEPMVDRVLDALAESRIDTVHAVTSPHVPETTAHLGGRVHLIEAPGDGYVEDLGAALETVEKPALTVVADLPLLAGEVVDRTLAAYDAGSLTVCVPTHLKEALGVSAETTRSHGGRECSPTGLNVVGDGDETIHLSYDARLAVNVNRPGDAEVAEVLARGP
ncbi:NTP transferase domain-containing protein [Natronomonas sp. CBA1123]|uniref:NTP transferase domain-containing protein n=1 Tax=Natronomonas sp. CBA1123 TaxID=2668070 RepID=UPI0012EA7D17|nr:NTP transferase domain-containing protein [Natronomonas sp. CBA1123]MUV88438.1 NTP transferase domain-containing protein [Natronomonas sp. CBA1123]